MPKEQGAEGMAVREAGREMAEGREGSERERERRGRVGRGVGGET